MHKRLVTALALISVTSVPALGASQPTAAFSVIVNRQNPAESFDRKFLAAAFLKKITRWPDDSLIQPVDLQPESPARRGFSEDVLNRSIMGMKSYWQQLIFSGNDVPPPELRSDQEVIQFVVKYPGAIGYVSGSAVTGDSDPPGIKVIGVK